MLERDNNSYRVRVKKGRVLLDGVPLGRGKVVVEPVFSPDGGAFAYAVREGAHYNLVVLPDFSQRQTIRWRIPTLVGNKPRLFWVGEHAVGMGRSTLMPRVVFRWTTQIAAR
jgi:hypothetical protein